MKQKGFSPLIIILIVTLVAAGAYYLGSKNIISLNLNLPGASSAPSPTIPPTSTPTPSAPQLIVTTEAPSLPTGWQTYQNTQYGFEISYPSEYQALDDSENLYGWSNGVVLLYNGGQAYDIAIEAWDTAADYEAKYPTVNYNLDAVEIGGKYITILDSTEEPGNAAVIATFKAL